MQELACKVEPEAVDRGCVREKATVRTGAKRGRGQVVVIKVKEESCQSGFLVGQSQKRLGCTTRPKAPGSLEGAKVSWKLANLTLLVRCVDCAAPVGEEWIKRRRMQPGR